MNSFSLKRLLRFILLLALFTTASFSVQIANDRFSSNLNGWSGSGIYHDNWYGEMVIPRDRTASKLYHFGSFYANATLVIEFRIYADSRWESNDEFNAIVGNTTVNAFHFRGNRYYTRSFITTADSNGDLQLRLNTDTDRNSEISYIDYVTINATLPPFMGDIPDQSAPQGVAFDLDISNYVTELDGNTVTYNLTCLPDGLSFSTATGVLNGAPTTLGTYNCSAFATDSDGASNTDTFVITVTDPPQVPPVMNPIPEQKIRSDINSTIDLSTFVTKTNGDPILSYTLTGTLPDGMSFDSTTGIISGVPTTISITSLSITATDDDGESNQVSFIINVVDKTNFQQGVQDFVLINPPNTRNIIGDYVIAGNTIECITNNDGTNDGWVSTDPADYSNTCQNSNTFNDNNYMAQYIDIDNASDTWNSSSSNITFPTKYADIVWAGLFWQGGINNNARNGFNQRRAFLNILGNVAYKYITSTQSLDLSATRGNRVLYKIDNEASYTAVQADTFYYDNAFFSNGSSTGGYYASFADVTEQLRGRNLSDGDHTVTVANITANEGRERGTGNYAGWSMVIIYREQALGGSTAKNISIYNGYTIIPSKQTVKISGFKLPKVGRVSSQFAAFAGEGEWLYGTPSNRYDRMIMSRFSNLSPSDTMPNAADPNNIFDAILAGISRDSGNNNNMTGNNNGIDIENYDVSSIMTNYRNADSNINTIYIGLSSSQDYVTPSMMAFSAELYKPKLCYDYTILKDGYDITKPGRVIDTVGSGDLSVNIALKSTEGDFDFANSQVGVRLAPTTNTNFIKAFYSPDSVNTLLPAVHTQNSTSERPRIAIGENITDLGGTIKRNQKYFAEFQYLLSGSDYIGKFEIDLNTTVDYGSGPVPMIQSTEYGDIPRCPQSNYYNPLEGAFNIERPDSAGETIANKKFPLYTQIVGKDFDFQLVAYNQSAMPPYSTELALSGYTVDLELINSSPYNDDRSVFTCNNPNQNIIHNLKPNTNNLFVKFPAAATSRVDLSSEIIQTDTALRNAAFRMWYLTDENGTVIKHTLDEDDNVGFQNLYDKYFKSRDNQVQPDGSIGYCKSDCAGYTSISSGKSGCYACLRDHFAKAICSRDNFAIRPASYRIAVLDSNESTDPTKPKDLITINNSDSNIVNLSAEYNYKFEGNATSYISDTTIAKGYTIDFNVSNPGDRLKSVLKFNTASQSCFDTNDSRWNVHFENGEIKGMLVNERYDLRLSNLTQNSNVGRYQYHIEDNNWTMVDQDDYIYKTFDGVNDCLINDSSIAATGTTRSGCVTSSQITANSFVYTDLNLVYRPYRFDVSDINLSFIPNNNSRLIFMNNFDDPYYSGNLVAQSIDMGVVMEGNVTALGKAGGELSNFTDGCVASDVRINLIRETVPSENNLSVQLQQYLQYGSTLHDDFDDKQLGKDANLTLAKAGFEDNITRGSARVKIYTTFKKPTRSTTNLHPEIDPIDISYKAIKTTGDSEISKADMITHLPTGTKDYDSNTTFVYGKVTPKKRLYNNVAEDYKITPIYVDIYCSLGDANCSAKYDLNTSSSGEQEAGNGWYLATPFN